MDEEIGWHYTLDANMKNPVKKERLCTLLKGIAKTIKMEIVSKTLLQDGAEYNAGVTSIVVIEFSHIAIHTFENNMTISFDVYSCKRFDKDRLTKFIKRNVQVYNENIYFRKRKTKSISKSDLIIA